MNKNSSAAADGSVPAPAARVFISYARADEESVIRLAEELAGAPHRLDVQGDWRLTAGPDYEPQLQQQISDCDAFVFVISPKSVASAECDKEVDLAVRWGKRIIPVLFSEGFDRAALRKELSRPQWVTACAAGRLAECAAQIASAVNTDFKLLAAHTSLLTDARQWEADAKRRATLLRGAALKSAEAWLASARAAGPDKWPRPTPLQEEFIEASRRYRKQFRAAVLALLLLGLLVTGVAVYPRLRNVWLRRRAAAGARLVGVEGLALRIEEHEVTQSRYRMCVTAGACSNPSGGEQSDLPLPVVEVTAVQASEFCRWIGRRLPTSCEWLRAATRGCTTRWPWGDDPPTAGRANLLSPGTNWWQTGPLTGGRREGEGQGAQDLIGNVWEWTLTYGRLRSDWDGVQTPPSDELVVKGGGFKTPAAEVDVPEHFSLKPGDSERHAVYYTTTADDLGFRCVAPAEGYRPEQCVAQLPAAEAGGKCLP